MGFSCGCILCNSFHARRKISTSTPQVSRQQNSQGLDINEGNNAAVQVATAQIDAVQVESKSEMFNCPERIQPAEEKLTVKTGLGESSSRLMDGYEAYEIDSGAPDDDMLLVPASESAPTASTATTLTITTTSAWDSSTHVYMYILQKTELLQGIQNGGQKKGREKKTTKKAGEGDRVVKEQENRLRVPEVAKESAMVTRGCRSSASVGGRVS
jgi:hypothetical protein